MSVESGASSRLSSLHQEVDEAAGILSDKHRARLQCAKGCAGCCDDELTVFEVEAARIREQFGVLLQTAEPHPPGACAFLDGAGACRIYEARPYVCRTQGLPLRWFEEDESEEIVEQRDICPLNAEGPALEALPEQDLWQLGIVEDQLRRLQLAAAGDERRVALRVLFAASRES